MNVLMIGPLAPPYGGVANFIEYVTKQDLKDFKIQIHRVGRREYDINLLRQFFIEILDIKNFIVRYKFRHVDLVHIHTSSDWSFYRTSIYFFILKLLSNNKILIHVHGAGFDNFYKDSFLISKKLIKYVLVNCDAIVVTSPKWVSILKNIVNNDIRQFIIYNGFDSSLFIPMPIKDIRELVDIPKDKKILLNIANLETYKGHKYLINAMEIIKKTRDDIFVYIIGEGPLKRELEKDIKNKGLDKNIFLLGGGKSSNEIINLLNACDILVLPSLEEGNPTVMFEALGCGKPFIGTRVGGIPDVIISDDYGLLSEPFDSKELADNILISLNKNWNYEKIRYYAKKFTWDNISKDLIQVYRYVI